MNTFLNTAGFVRCALLTMAGALAMGAATAADVKVTLSGDHEVPAVNVHSVQNKGGEIRGPLKP